MELNAIFSLLHAYYDNIDRVKIDVCEVLDAFQTLFVKVKKMNNSTESRVLALGGTVPMMFREIVYHIPIEIFIPTDYPDVAPTVYVRPTLGMCIVNGHRFVKQSGIVNVPNATSISLNNLVQLCSKLGRIFGQYPPLYSHTNPEVPSLSTQEQVAEIEKVSEQTIDVLLTVHVNGSDTQIHEKLETTEENTYEVCTDGPLLNSFPPQDEFVEKEEETIGEYKYVRKMSKVSSKRTLFKATHIPSNEEVILKRRLHHDEKCMHREIAILNYLKESMYTVEYHQHFDHCRGNVKGWYVCMEKGGMSLKQWICKIHAEYSGRELKCFLEIAAKKVVTVVEQIHSYGIVWGHVKPSNFILKNGDNILGGFMGVDFESSTVIDCTHFLFDKVGRESEQKNMAYADRYVSPERAKAILEDTSFIAQPWEDIWSVGMVLFFITTRMEFNFDYLCYGQPKEFSDRLKSCEVQNRTLFISSELLGKESFKPSLPKGMHPNFEEAILACLNPKSQERPTSTSVITILDSDRIESDKKVMEIFGQIDENLKFMQSEAKRTRNILSYLVHSNENDYPKNFIIVPKKRFRPFQKSNKRYFFQKSEAKLYFLCEFDMKPVLCGPDGKGFTVRDGCDFASNFTSVMQFPLQMICIAADLAITGGTLIVLNGCEVLNEDVDEKKQFGLKTDDLKIYEVAQYFKPYLEQDEAKNARALVDQYDDESNIPCQTETIIQKKYKEFIEYMNAQHPLWKEQHGLHKNVDNNGVISWYCCEHSQIIEQVKSESEKKKGFRRTSVTKIRQLTNSISEGATTMLTTAFLMGNSKGANVENVTAN